MLDFVVTFYEGDLNALNQKPSVYNYVSSHIINGYTVDNIIPSNLHVGFVNYYMGATKGNQGWTIPTLIRVKGTLTDADLLYNYAYIKKGYATEYQSSSIKRYSHYSLVNGISMHVQDLIVMGTK